MEWTANRLRFATFVRDGFGCIYCGRSSIEDEAKIHVERLDPEDGDVFENMVTVCKECGETKGSLPLSRTMLGRFTAVIGERSRRFHEEQRGEGRA
jgi:5-methylcytosine-specific restriction endonuclease McrA